MHNHAQFGKQLTSKSQAKPCSKVAQSIMITTRFYLDCRAVKPGCPAPLRLVITRRGVRALLPTGVNLTPEQWDASRQAVVFHPRRAALNNMLMARKVQADDIICRLDRCGELEGLNATGIKNLVLAELEGAEPDRQVYVAGGLKAFIETKTGRTRQLYEATYHRLRAFCPDFERLRYDDITVQWLERFDAHMAQTSPSRNARNIHMRNLRAVFNRAIDDEVTTKYPFRRFKLRPEPTVKRAMSIEQIRKIASAQLPEWQVPYRDMWLLSFCLLGINVVDLCRLGAIDGQGRVQYVRAKTHKAYSVKVEPEALAIIERYRGQGQLLNMLDTHTNYRTWYQQLCRGLRAVKDELNSMPGPRIESLTSYWARHSWATTAAALDIPKETIAAALGHGGNTVTDVYIDFDARKVDEANRRVLDFVFGLSR